MKRYINITLAMAITIATLFSCDIIEPPYLEDDNSPIPQDSIVRKVLLEDFTGFRCKSCPQAMRIAEQIETHYSGQVIVVAVHAGYYATPQSNRPWSYDFRTEAGTVYDNFFGISLVGNPNGMINRTGYATGNHIYGPNSWAQSIHNLIDSEPKMTLALDAVYNNETREIVVDAKIEYLKQGKSNHQLTIYAIEDGIVHYQLDGDADVLDYVHNHVLRGALNGTWGETISNSDISIGQKFEKRITYTIPQDSDWNTGKMKIVGYIHDFGDTYEVLQAEQVTLKME